LLINKKVISKENDIMKVFISQPMVDKTDEEIEMERDMAICKLKEEFDESIEIIDSFFKDVPHDAAPLWYLGESIKLLGDADAVYFCKDWEQYRGCAIEHECAVRYGKMCIYA
jgi:hypothetical protein